MSGLPGRFSTNTHPDYELIRELGRGANGVVFEAIQRKSKRPVALKLMLSAGASDPNQVSRFIREGRTLAQLDHSGIAKVHSFDSEAGNYWMAMQLIKGADLSTVVKERVRLGQAFSIEQGLKWFRELLEILDYCREMRVAHRDFKPSNIIVEDETNRIVLVDFGLLKTTNPLMTGQSRLTETGEVIGTPAFMSPEQIDRSFGEVTTASDIWALGATMFYCATGEAPFVRKTIPALCIAIMMSEVPSLSLGESFAEKKYTSLVGRCLVKDVKKRPEASVLLRVLEEEEVAENPRGIGLGTILGAFVILLILILALYGSKGSELNGATNVEIKGQIIRTKGHIKINGRSVSVAKDGTFSIHLEARTDPEKVEIELRFECNGGLTEDSGPAETVTIEGADWHVHQTKAPLLEGAILGAGVSLKINSREVEVKNGRFEYTMLPEAKELTAKDGSGVKPTRFVECVFPETFAEKTKILHDVRSWNRAKIRAQDIALGIVTAKLGKKWSFLSARKWRCGGKGHRIGTFIHRKSKIEFQLIPGGSFLMGSTEAEVQSHDKFGFDKIKRHEDAQKRIYMTPFDAEQPQHKVTLKPFLIAAFETAKHEWTRLITTYQDLSPLPHVVRSYLTVKRELREGKVGLRLPSESEWEYACRAGTRTRFFWGNEVDESYLWYAVNSDRTLHSTREHENRRNAFGLADTAGNVWELCEDYYWRDYKEAPSDGSAHRKPDPRGPWSEKSKEALYVCRGGRVLSWAGPCRSARRFQGVEKNLGDQVGFRLAMSLPKID
ncbi:MAG: bifunctional serine/threonine-protein kinase/formylglycine-generating enzyme family protein [Planctomycetota bacterium]|nr:bifunctional serine/threonine-protein kinase/formylglycine-generating enzyme family protein [Planctomycetota bacterium]